MCSRVFQHPSQAMPGGHSLQKTEHKHTKFCNNATYLHHFLFQIHFSMYALSSCTSLSFFILCSFSVRSPCTHHPVVVAVASLLLYCCLCNECCLCCLLEPEHYPSYPGVGWGAQNCQQVVQYLDEALIQIRKPLTKLLRLISQPTLYCFLQSMHSCVFHIHFSNQGVGTWEEQEHPDCLSAETVMRYYAPILAQLKAKFPNHSFLKGDESHQQWWVNQKTNL